MTEEIWLIGEENHGFLVAATSMLAGKQWLINSAWVTMESEIYIPQIRDYVTLKDQYGENWKKYFLSYDEEELENMGFLFRKAELYKEK